ncbi:MAG: dicarboxylate/amino acid:cation symporter [Candidatus Kapabacteria bacterium]|nr:dicarboxylate/amino acid:cation symporter [Ignavibacteriota bacterium]MCW5884766.1 dicarboxylate/amino acid:cation symporter [Candidatus Kapabacteria bacterium]
MMKKFPLHLQILLALFLGGVFGSIFSIDENTLEIEFRENNKYHQVIIKNWDKINFVNEAGELIISHINQTSIIKHFSKNYKTNPAEIIIVQNGTETQYSNVIDITKQQTIATVIKPIGDIFIRLLSFLAIPLVIASLVVGAASLGDVKKLGKIGLKTFTFYIVTTAIAITIGLIIANVIRPGEQLPVESKQRLMESFESDSPATNISQNLDIDLIDFIVKIVPKNPFDALANGNMLQIVFFTVFFGISLTFVSENARNSVLGVFSGTSDTLIKMVGFVMLLAPYGVFALISATVADFGFEIISTLVWYIFSVLLGLFLHMSLVYLPIVKIFTKVPVKDFLLAMRNAQAIAFSTSSSAATLPVTMDCVENNLNVPKKISGFVLPLGATINMDGTALYQGVAAVFIAQVYGMDLGLTEQLTIVFTAVLASIGTAPVPGVGIIMLVMILQSVHIPAEGIALIIGVDRILDMARTINNITGDAAVTIAVAAGEQD